MQVLDNTFPIHVRFDGRSEDLNLATLGLRPSASDGALRSALARHYECSVAKFDGYVIQREPQGIIARPMAIYG